MGYTRPVSQALPGILLLVGTTTLGAASMRGPNLARAAQAEMLPARACPGGMLDDDGICVRIPEGDDGAPDAPSSMNRHRDKSGRWTEYEQIPRRPERPADYDAYVYPIAPGMPGGHAVISGYDLDRPDPAQRRGARLSHVGHGGVDLPQKKGHPIRLVALEHQRGPVEVLHAGPLFGTTVVTKHTVLEGGDEREYLLLFGHMDTVAPGVVRGAMLEEGSLVGTVGDTGSPELVHLHLEARRVRQGVDIHRPLGGMLLASEVSVVCDPRNVLPLRESTLRAPPWGAH